ncbi:hypothetical protein [Streptomyces sp. NPDC016845]|uniref:hypothetical protein n=1 Tax=Streptomyces sp. NPDC016845 TaxID=3364972 RepID=UPI0037884F43
MGLVQAPAAAADSQPEEDTGYYRNTIGQTARLDRCLAGVALHFGGAKMKAKAIEGLSGTAAELRTVVGDVGWIGLGPLGQARDGDGDDALDYRETLKGRSTALEDANKPYASSAYASPDMQWHAPEFDADILQFTLFTQDEMSGRLGWEGHSTASKEAVARAEQITEQNRGEDSWHDSAADFMLREENTRPYAFSGGTTGSDIASYLKHGGFLKETPAEGSAEYRIVVEDLKQAWAACDYQNPVDMRRVLNAPLMTAMTEWETEYAAQAAPRATIVNAEAAAAAATRAATDDMLKAIGQAWRADQILTWRKFWQDRLAAEPDVLGAPGQALYDRADADMAAIRKTVQTLVTSAGQHAADAAAAAQKAATAQQQAWGIADAGNVPRGRGLAYAQQSVQVARASGAASEAAAKATRTALEAVNATVADSDTLLAAAQTQSHAINTEFRRIAAQEAAAQAKAAADTADAEAKAATTSASDAKKAQATAEEKSGQAHDAAATAQTKRAESELEHATAVASRATAATQRTKAQQSEKDADTRKTAADQAKTTAATAATTAKAKRTTADAKAKAAATARAQAAAALQKKQATAARAAALAAAAAAAAGTATAAETKQAAEKARTAAQEAAGAATAAQTASQEAVAAAVTARSAATVAEGAAKRAQAGADKAWSAYLSATGAAADAHVAAARALDDAQDAAIRSDNAATASENATEAAKKAAQESSSAGVEAAAAVATAGTAVGRAYAAGQSALAARDSAGQVIAAANEAVSIGTAYQETDASAAFAALVGQNSKSLAEQQAAAAEAKAAEASRAAEAAQKAAAQADGDAKLAAEAAAQAAVDSVRAAEAVERAQASSAQAATAQKAAQKAAESASSYATQAGADAVSARNTADATQNEATQADREATEAERSAARASEVAERASSAADKADSKATQAEQDAKDAEAKAADADANSNAAEQDAAKAEQEKREQNEADRQEALKNGNTAIAGGAGNWPALGDTEEQILLDKCGQTCVDDYRNGLKAVSVDLVDWVADHGGQILLDELGATKVKQCLALDGTEDCLWSQLDIAAEAVIVGRIPALSEAAEKVSDGVRDVLLDAYDAEGRLTELTRLISKVRSTPRLEQCLAGVALHVGGSNMKAKAIEGLTGTAGELHAIIGDSSFIGLEPLGQARDKDTAAGFDYRDSSASRKSALEDANRPYAMSSFSDDISLHAPEFDKQILQFTLSTQAELAGRLGWDGHSNAGPEAIAQAKKITEENRGKDSWNDFAADIMLRDGNVTNPRFSGGTTATDIAGYLQHGGFLMAPPATDSAEYRVEVENLKQAWSSCDHQDPVDPHNALASVVATATAEWKAEYASQAAPRAVIVQAEADAAAATREASDDMVEAVGQAWLAEQILLWQKYWHDYPDSTLKPKKALFDRANADLARARGKVQALVTSAKQYSTAAQSAATRAVTAQQQAYDIADANKVPRGRGLSYAQQSVQVARASGAAAQAAAKATETALNAANATVADSKTLYALAQTQTHALNTEFRRIAAQEAAAQAKASADSAEAYATAAAANAKTAKDAQAVAAAQKDIAKKEAENAAAKALVAEAERANAAAYRATAADERQKAGAAEDRAQTKKDEASEARGVADAAAGTAEGRYQTALRAESDAEYARDQAFEAERTQKAYEARAAALESAAAAAVGTEAAGEAQQAANEARAAANQAATAASGARAAAAEATTAATNARAAATNAESSAAKSRTASNDAWSSYWNASSAAATAHVAAAEAIDAAEAASANAEAAGKEAANAKKQAAIAHDNAVIAHAEAIATAKSAAETAGHAYATTQAALAARDTATQTAASANTAIAVGTPYKESDSAAAFAVLTGQQALTTAEQQALAAQAKSDEAQRMAKEAKALADQAAKDDKAAADAAASAAGDAARALTAFKNAQKSAAEAKAAASSAQKLANEADGYAAQAGSSAVAADVSASSAESEAAAADREATAAEHDAASARQAASDATDEADAADFSARMAQSHASAAKDAADNANEAASDAQASADRAEKAERERLAEERRLAMANGDTGAYGGSPDTLSANDRALLLQICGQSCVDDWDAANKSVSQTVVDWLKANGADILLEFIGVNDIKRCFGEGDIESCLWTLVDVGSLVLVVGKLPKVAKAITTVTSGIGRFFERAQLGKRTLEHLRKVLEEYRKNPDRGSIKLPGGSNPCTHPGAKECKNIEFPYKNADGSWVKGRDWLGSDNKYHVPDGAKGVDVYDVASDPMFKERITDIDYVKDGILWEEKSVSYPMDVAGQKKWIDKHIPDKVKKYLDARRFVKGYENAPIGFRFDPEALKSNPGLKKLVEDYMHQMRIKYDVDIRIWWVE